MRVSASVRVSNMCVNAKMLKAAPVVSFVHLVYLEIGQTLDLKNEMFFSSFIF